MLYSTILVIFPFQFSELSRMKREILFVDIIPIIYHTCNVSLYIYMHIHTHEISREGMREKRESAVEFFVSYRMNHASVYPKIPVFSYLRWTPFVRLCVCVYVCVHYVLLNFATFSRKLPCIPGTCSLTFAIDQMDRNVKSPQCIISPGSIIDPSNWVRLS